MSDPKAVRLPAEQILMQFDLRLAEAIYDIVRGCIEVVTCNTGYGNISAGPDP